MATNIDKPYYTGVGQLPAATSMNGEDKDIIVIVSDEPEKDPLEETHEEIKTEHDENLAEILPDSVLGTLAGDLLFDYDKDERDRKDWIDTYVKGLDLLGLKYEERSEPWAGACGVFHPLLMEAAVKFQSEAIMETFPAMGPVRTKIIGKETPDKKQAAARVEADMNYELTEVMQEYRPEHERLLLGTCLSGNGFKKIYFDPALGRQTAPYIPAEDIVVPYGSPNIESAERITHRMRKTKNEIKKLQVAGFYRDIDLGEPMQIMDELEKHKLKNPGQKDTSITIDSRFLLLEMHVNLDLIGHEDKNEKGEHTGIALPYIVTIEKGGQKILAIRRNWLEDDKLKQKRQHFVHYGYIPGFGFYYFGLIHLIGGHAKSATSLIRQLVDAGTLSNLPGGLKARGLRIKGDDTPIEPGEFRDVDLPSGTIRDNILPLPYKEPSQVLVGLMDKIVEDGRRFAAVSDLNISDMSNQAPVGTTLAILERVLKVMSAVQARIHFTMKQEFKLLAAIIRDHTPEDYDYEPETGQAGAKKGDYDHCDVLPVSDPNAATMSQRVVQYQAVLQLSQTAPQIYDLPFLHRQMIETLGVKNSAKIVPMKDDMRPMDPVSENMAILMGKPVKAFMEQDHESHIQVHMGAMQDPKMMAIVGQNPQAPLIMAAGSAHLMEHVAYEYRRQIEKMLGSTLPPPPDVENDSGYLDPQMEAQVSQLAAQATAKLLKKDQAEAQAQQAAQQQQDPLIQMQMKDLQIKEQLADLKKQQLALDARIQQGELERKKQKDITDAAARADELQLKKQQLEEEHEIAGAQIGTDMIKHQDKQELEGAKIGSQIGQHKENLAQKKTESAMDLLKHASTHEHEKEMKVVDQAHDKSKYNVEKGIDSLKHVSNLDHQAGEGEKERQHKSQEAMVERVHKTSEAEAEREHQAKEAEAERKHQAEQAKQAAKNKPANKEPKK
jgi:hypothetical protein